MKNRTQLAVLFAAVTLMVFPLTASGLEPTQQSAFQIKTSQTAAVRTVRTKAAHAAIRTEAQSDMQGTFSDNKYNSILLTRTGDNTYEATVSIYRLSTFEGTGSMDAGSMNLTLTDPNDGTLYATFTPNGDGTYSLTIVDSTWSLLDNGTVFDGFRMSSVG